MLVSSALACWTGYHALITSHALDNILASELGRLVPWSWFASRLFLSALLLLGYVVWFVSRLRPYGWVINPRLVSLSVAGLLVMAKLVVTVLPLPRAYVPEWSLARPAELIPALFFGLALTGYLYKGSWRKSNFEHWLVLALITSLAGQAAFMVFSAKLFDAGFDLGHLLKLASYLCVLSGLLVRVSHAFREVHNASLTLETTNRVLEQEIVERIRTQEHLEERSRALQDAHERQHHLATHDALTGLPNRQLFRNRLDQALMHARCSPQPFAVLFLDLDRFKNINDTLGQAAGDELLKTMAHRLRACVRESDTVARLGGDEFTVLLTHLTNTEDPSKVAQKILAALVAPLNLHGQNISIFGSVGIAVYPQDGQDADSMVQHADMAMYRAKQEGRAGFRYYTAEINASSRARLNLENDLRLALTRNEFLLHYQPLVDLASNRIYTVEALLRWQHPRCGAVSPADFIPVAEEAGLIGAIGEWVLHEACAQNRAWQDAGLPPVRVAVNLSPAQCSDPRLVERVREILQQRRLDGRWLELEITEGVVMHHSEQALENLVRLKALGIRIVIDDLGTGYSSLSYLNRFPVDGLKVDHSFIRNVCNDKRDAAITKATIAMAHSLGLSVVAEGVETAGQEVFLRAHNCKSMQGFLISCAIPADRLAVMLAKNDMECSPVGRIAAGG